MSETKNKILKNVFIPQAGNNLRLCDIYYSEKIERIVPLAEKIFDWKDIDTKEKLQALKEKFSSGETGQNVIDGNYLIAIPGAIDPHVHFDTPGFEFRDTFQEASYAAACGGVTTVIDMPCTSIPPVTSLNNFRTKLEAVKNSSHVDFAFWGGIAGNSFAGPDVEKNILDLADAGVAGFKAYFISGMDTFTDLTFNEMKAAAQFTKKAGKPLAVHAEDRQTILNIQNSINGDDLRKWESYCEARGIEAEVKSVTDLISIASEIDARIHVVHLSSRDGLNLIRDAQKKGISVTAETCPHYLYFTQDAFGNGAIRNFLKTAPPVKFEEDRDALWLGLAEGSILFVTTDHAGCDPAKEKSSDDFSKVYGGIPGVEHRVPFLFSEGFLKGRITLEQTIKQLASGAADYFNLTNKGYIKEGFDADIAMMNLWSSETVAGNSMHSKGKYTPFEGVVFNAVVEKTFLRGNLIAEKSSSICGTDDFLKNNFFGKFIHV